MSITKDEIQSILLKTLTAQHVDWFGQLSTRIDGIPESAEKIMNLIDFDEIFKKQDAMNKRDLILNIQQIWREDDKRDGRIKIIETEKIVDEFLETFENKPKCEAGCKHFSDGTIKHNKHCLNK